MGPVESGTYATKAEIRDRAAKFAVKWKDATSEQAERQSFWNDFFAMFGVERKQVAIFEQIAKRTSTDNIGWIDLLDPKRMAVEHKSAGADLDAAMDQLIDYLPSLTPGEHPWLLVACDFQRFKWQNLETDESGEFTLAELPDHIELFWWLAGYDKPHQEYATQEEASLAATGLLAAVSLRLEENGYDHHDLREWMTRILFILFADDTGIWDRAAFHSYISLHTRQDGTDLGPTVQMIFEVLNTPPYKRQKNLDEDLQDLTYVNGDLFANRLSIPVCDRETRDALLWASAFNWGAISPAIFGSLFQNAMESKERRQLGAHYTTEENILKVIEPLFLDELWAELDAAKTAPALRAFHDKLAGLKFIDPACGCGNFLVIAYRELRRIETETLRRLAKKEEARKGRSGQRSGQRVASLEFLCRVKVDQFYGIEVDEWPARIARTAMYLTDHLANREVSAEFGEHYVRFPIPASPHIVIGNALRIDWTKVLPDPDWVFGNPPFVDRKNRDSAQRDDHSLIHGSGRGTGNLDYVTCWFAKAVPYMQATGARTAFVATNSITQGSQVPELWPRLFEAGVTITFAHRPFAWKSEARGMAHVHVVIIGMAIGESPGTKMLWDYPDPKEPGIETAASCIGPYLTDSAPIVVHRAGAPIVAGVPKATYGATAGDKGHLLFTEDTVAEALADPIAKKYLRLYIGADELLNGQRRWVLWLDGVPASEMRKSSLITDRVAKVKKFRSDSNRAGTKAAAATPWLLLEPRAPSSDYLLVPCVSSERREYVPMEMRGTETIVRASSWFIEGADMFLFGMLHSAMFMAWVRTVGGRLESRLQVSAETVYNTFPFPEPTPAARQKVEKAAAKVVAARKRHSTSTLDDLYDPTFMPIDLRAAHNDLDRAADAAMNSRKQFRSDADRLAYLLHRYEAITSPLVTTPTAKRRRATKP